jgi:hypothetical protein
LACDWEFLAALGAMNSEAPRKHEWDCSIPKNKKGLTSHPVNPFKINYLAKD